MIKKAFRLVAITAFMMTVSCQKEEAKMEFAEKEFNFGTIKEGDKVEHVFSFKNTGTSDLLITRAKGSCGCTIPDYPKGAIRPGESGNIKVSFNSAHKHGTQHKTVALTANTKQGTEILKISADVLPNPVAPTNGVSGIAAPTTVPEHKKEITLKTK